MKKSPVDFSIAKHEKPPVEGSIAVGARPEGGYGRAKKKALLRHPICILISNTTYTVPPYIAVKKSIR